MECGGGGEQNEKQSFSDSSRMPKTENIISGCQSGKLYFSIVSESAARRQNGWGGGKDRKIQGNTQKYNENTNGNASENTSETQ